MRKLLLLSMVFVFYSCAVKQAPKVSTPYKAPSLDTESAQQLNKILDRVEKMSTNMSLESLGRGTMDETVKVLDFGTRSADILSSRLKTSSEWKFRYWLVDILGYVQNKNNIYALIEVIEDKSEKLKTRLRACESLEELGYSEIVPQLKISNDIIKEPILRNKITETIKSFK